MEGGVLLPGHSYEIQESSTKNRLVIFVHSIRERETRKDVTVTIRVTKFCHRDQIPLLTGMLPSTTEVLGSSPRQPRPFRPSCSHEMSNSLFLVYSDWDSRGRESDAADMDIEDISEVIQECQVRWNGITTIQNSEIELPTYDVTWAYCASKVETYFRRLPDGNRWNESLVAINDFPTVVDCFCGLGAFSRGFSDAGYRIVAGIDKAWSAASTFNVQSHSAPSLMTRNSTPPVSSFLKISETS